MNRKKKRKSKKQLKKIIVRVNLPWMPKRFRGLNIRFRFSMAERLVYRRRKRIPVSQWAEQHIMVTRGPLEGTKWRNKTAQYLAGIMDASFFFSVEEIVLCAADQVGKTVAIDICIGYAIDRAPGPVLIVYPDEDTTKENIRGSILPMINQSPRLRKYLTGTHDDEGIKRIALRHMQIHTGWAHSAARMAHLSIKYLKLDEVDKYPETAGKKEASPISKAEKRLRTFRYSGRKTWKSSTPNIEAGPITKELNKCQMVFDYFVCCPDCGEIQYMEFIRIRVPEGQRDPEKIEKENLARYECAECGSMWTDLKRDVAVRWGQWRARSEVRGQRSEIGDQKKEEGGGGLELFAYLKEFKPKKIGFHLPSWLSHFVGLSEPVAAFFRGQTDTNELKDFLNSHAAEPWSIYGYEREEDKILALRDDRPRGIVPNGDRVSCLTAGMDTQDKGFWFEIRAWGWGMSMESWQIREGYVDSFDGLAEVIFNSRYVDVDDNEYFVRFAVHDAMGKHTSEVYDFARLHRGRMLPFQGKGSMTQPVAYSNLSFYPGTNKKIPGGLVLLRADVNFFKNQLSGKLEIKQDDPGAWHYHNETTEEWARQMCAEVIDEKKGVWINPKDRANHGWDCSVYNLVAADVIGVKFMRKEKTTRAAGRRVVRKGKRIED